jgi:HEAT repeat protein
MCVLIAALLVIVWAPAVSADDPTPAPGSVIADLNSEDPQVRAEAVAALMVFGDPSAADALFDLLADPDPKVGLYAAQALGALASPENLPALRDGLRHRNPNVRWRTALVLGQMGDARAVPALARALDDPEVLVHRTAAESLVNIGTPAAASALVRALGSGTESVAYAARNGLVQMDQSAVTPLAIGLSTGNSRRRLNAASLLGYLADPRALSALRAAATSDADEAVRAEAQWAINQINNRD